jgi:DNA-binding response OmpR family regulator
VILDLESVPASRAQTICKSLKKASGTLTIALVHGRWPEEEMEGAAYLTVSTGLPRLAANLRHILDSLSQAEMASNGVQNDSAVVWGQLRLDPVERQLAAGKRTFHLTPKETRLLQELMSHPGLVLTRGWLMRNVWDTDYTGDTRTLYVHVRWLREKIEEDPRSPRVLKTIRGVGYTFDVQG